jgi:hypothetical protein
MGTMPPEEGAEEEKGASPIKRSPDLRDLRYVELTISSTPQCHCPALWHRV